jgi:hypothetical protein
LNSTNAFPFSLSLNDCETQITRDFDKGTSFYDILKFCWESNPKLVARIVSDEN